MTKMISNSPRYNANNDTYLGVNQRIQSTKSTNAAADKRVLTSIDLKIINKPKIDLKELNAVYIYEDNVG